MELQAKMPTEIHLSLNVLPKSENKVITPEMISTTATVSYIVHRIIHPQNNSKRVF